MTPIRAVRCSIFCFRLNTRSLDLSGGARAGQWRQPGDVGIPHHRHQLLEFDRRFPAKLRTRLAGVANQVIDFGGTDERRVGADMALPVQPGVTERRLDEFLDRMAYAGGDYVVV